MPGPVKRIFLLDSPSGEPLPVVVSVPDGEADLPEVLPYVHHICESMSRRTQAAAEKEGRMVRCAPGCAACCHELITLGEAEAVRLLRLMAALPEPRRAGLRERFAAAERLLSEAGLRDRLLEIFRHRIHEKEAYDALRRDYLRLRLPCPFLEDGLCAVYQERPLVCRTYLAASPPERCWEWPEGAEVDILAQPLDLAGAAAAFDGQLPQRTRALPLALALSLEGELSGRTWPRLPARTMLQRFLDYASMCYGARG